MTLPAGLLNGTYSMVITANGIASDPMSIITASEGCSPCEIPANLVATNIATTTATLNWGFAAGGLKYNLSYKPSLSSVWTVVKSINTTSYNLTGLTINTSYDFKVQTVCASKTKSKYSSVFSFTTSNGTYCATSGNTTYEFINKVVLGSINNTSGNNNGYGDFTALSTNLAAGIAAAIKLTPGYSGTAYTEYFEVYIDYNQNGVFTDKKELIFSDFTSTVLSKKFTVPLTAKSGPTRMRIIMHYNTPLGQPCGDFSDGEAEDYTVNITGGTLTAGITYAEDAAAKRSVTALVKLQALPNPNNGDFNVQLNLPSAKCSTMLTLYNSVGKKVWENNMGIIGGNISENVYLQNKLASGLYVLTVRRDDLNYSTKVTINK